jgi:hypothetical protein
MISSNYNLISKNVKHQAMYSAEFEQQTPELTLTKQISVFSKAKSLVQNHKQLGRFSQL